MNKSHKWTDIQMQSQSKGQKRESLLTGTVQTDRQTKFNKKIQIDQQTDRSKNIRLHIDKQNDRFKLVPKTKAKNNFFQYKKHKLMSP